MFVVPQKPLWVVGRTLAVHTTVDRRVLVHSPVGQKAVDHNPVDQKIVAHTAVAHTTAVRTPAGHMPAAADHTAPAADHTAPAVVFRKDSTGYSQRRRSGNCTACASCQRGCPIQLASASRLLQEHGGMLAPARRRSAGWLNSLP